MAEEIKVGDRVEVCLTPGFWKAEGWFAGVVVRIDPYSAYRSFIWVQLDESFDALQGKDRLISVLNPKNIRKV